AGRSTLTPSPFRSCPAVMSHGLPVRSDTIAETCTPYGSGKIDDQESACRRSFSSSPRSSFPNVCHGSVLVFALSLVPSEIDRASVYDTWNVADRCRLLNEACSASYHDVVVPSMSVTVPNCGYGRGCVASGPIAGRLAS